jgi:hypothetical protein
MWAALNGWADALLELSQSWSCWTFMFSLLALFSLLRDAAHEEVDPEPDEPAVRTNTNTQPFHKKGA